MKEARGIFPLPDAETLADVYTKLAQRLVDHGFRQTDVLPVPGDVRHVLNDPDNIRRYLRGSSSGYESSAISRLIYLHFGRLHPDTLTLFVAFTLTRPVPRAELEALIGRDLYDQMIALQILVEARGEAKSRVQASAVGTRILFHDHFDIPKHESATHVFLGRCSTRLARHVEPLLAQAQPERACDLCTGSGVQALVLSRVAKEVVGGDVNPRALAFARANAAANGVAHARFVESNVWQNIEGRFDFVTANTPFFLLLEGSRALSGNGGKLGMEIASRIYAGLDEHLTARGRGVFIASSAIRGSRDLLQDELTELFGSKGYAIDLYPISLHFPPVLWDKFAAESVHHSVLYIVDIQKGASAFQLRVHDWPPLIRTAHELQLSAKRFIGWARHRS